MPDQRPMCGSSNIVERDLHTEELDIAELRRMRDVLSQTEVASMYDEKARAGELISRAILNRPKR